jgi:predicted DCC family thiol-disulfide oxidoreductase YuxK
MHSNDTLSNIDHAAALQRVAPTVYTRHISAFPPVPKDQGMSTSMKNRLATGTAALMLLMIGSVFLSYNLLSSRLPGYIADHSDRLFFFVGVLAATGLLLLSVLLYQPLYNLVVRYFEGVTSPFNLAIFRIVFFAAFLRFVIHEVTLERVIFFSTLPRELMFPTPGLGPVISRIPLNPLLVEVSGYALLLCCFSAMIGFRARTSALLVTLLGLYVLGVPQIWGKVNHYHHLIWFAAILSVSRCADVLSVDALLAARRRADAGDTAPPAAHNRYALPIRFVWLLMGVAYLFPGLWKAYVGGWAWAFSDNMIFRMYQKWFELGGWQPLPIFRMDYFPWMTQAAGAATILVEVGFIFALFLPRLRYLVAFGAFMFHTGVFLTMRIWFWTLQLCYITFIDWHWLGNTLGRRAYREPLFLLYDGNCQLCRRTVARIRTFDIVGRVTYVNALDEAALLEHNLTHLDRDALLYDMHAVRGEQVWRGFEAYRVLLRRIPLLWALLPLLYIPPVPALGRRVYRRVADARTCSIVQAVPPTLPKRHLLPMQGVAVMGVFLLATNFLFGAAGATYAWPFASYPTFQELVGPTITTLRVVARGSDGQLIPLDEQAIKRKLSGERWAGMLRWMLRTKNENNHEQRLHALAQLLLANDPHLRKGDTLEIYNAVYSTLPDRYGQPPLRQELMLSLKL